MRSLPTNDKCCGCTACAAICPKNAIKMLPDAEGLLQPVIDASICVDCGACARVCPVLNQAKPREPLACYIAKSLNDEERMKSSSGGIFSVFARHILAEGGKVYGVAWKKDPFRAAHIGVDSVEGLTYLRGSKYVQSEMGTTYREVRADLQSGRKVLFTGCPCQIAGLKSFLGKDFDNLITQEVICNSAPSPRVFGAWVRSEQKKAPGEELLNVNFRDKSVGWHNATLKFTFTTTTTTNMQLSAYYRLWQRGYSVRRSCIECDFRDFKSGADLTIGDFWGVEAERPEYDDNKGVSTILVNTARGAKFLEEVRAELLADTVSFASVIKKNPCLHKSFDLLKTAGTKREAFWESINEGADIQKLGVKLTRDPMLVRIRLFVGRLLRRWGLRK